MLSSPVSGVVVGQESQQDNLKTIFEWFRGGAVSRVMYLAEVHVPKAV
jgi:hypothetical protein